MSYAIDFDPYMQSTLVRPLLQGSVVEHNGSRYTVDRWFRNNDQHCYIFVPEKGSRYKPFAKAPLDVVELLENDTIKIISIWPLAQPSTKK